MAFLPPTASSIGLRSVFLPLFNTFCHLLCCSRLPCCSSLTILPELSSELLELLCQGGSTCGAPARAALSQPLPASGFPWLHFEELGNVTTQGRVAGGALSPREWGEFAAWAASVINSSGVFSRADRNQRCLERSMVSEMIAQTPHRADSGQATALFWVVLPLSPLGSAVSKVRLCLAVCCKELHPLSLCHQNTLWGWPAIPSFYCT